MKSLSTEAGQCPRRRHLWLSAALLLLLLAIPATASAATGTIAGKVTDASSHAELEGIRACASKFSGFGFGGCATTGADGKYTIANVEPGSYKVEFSTTSGSPLNYLAQYYDSAASEKAAKAVAVAAANTTNGIDAEMHPGGQITGTVTDELDDPFEGVQVCAYFTQGPGQLVDCVSTDASGEYTIPSLKTSTYKVKFSPGLGETSPGTYTTLNYAVQYYDGKANGAEATPVAVTAGAAATAGIDAQMVVGGRVTGTVTNAATAPLENVEVCVSPAANQHENSGCGKTDADGAYAIQGLSGGSYKVAFTPTSYAGKYAKRYYHGKAGFAAADPVAVSTGATHAEVDETLPEQGGISGTVTAAVGGGAIAGIEVCANQVGGGFEAGHGCATTGVGGGYTIPRLPPASYLVKFEGGEDHIDQYFDAAVREGEAQPVTVGLAATTPEIDAALQPAGKIQGSVVDAAGNAALEGFEVCAMDAVRFGTADCTVTDGDGDYEIGGLAGSYRIHFSAPFSSPSSNYVNQYYDDKAALSRSTPVTVAAGADVSGVDAEMQVGGEIAGGVSDDSSQPLEGVLVCASAAGGRPGFGECDTTDGAGQYSIDRLGTGDYKVRFSPEPFSDNVLGQYYDNKPSRQAATPVAVTAGSKTSGIDAQLHAGGKVTGMAIDAVSKEAIPAMQICAIEPGNPAHEHCAPAGPDGGYAIEGVPTGNYEILAHVASQPKPYLDERYDSHGPGEAGDPVAVTAGATTTGIDFELHRGGAVSGSVVDFSSKAPLQTILVCGLAVDGDREEEGGCDFTDAEGHYTLEGLPDGAYKVRFSHGYGFGFEEASDPNYVTQYYNDKLTEAEASTLAVSAGATISGVDAEMRQGGGISGKVVGPASEPLRGIYVCAEIASEPEPADCAGTNASGHYELEGLGDRSYAVSFSPWGTSENPLNFLAEYYDNKPIAATATPVTVTGAAVTPDIDAQLQAGGQIHGRVTDASDESPLLEAFVCVYAVGGDSEPVNCAEVDLNGEYIFPALPAGSYQVEFSAGYEEEGGGVVEGFATQFYPAKPIRAEASSIPVTLGATTNSIDASMLPPGAPHSALSVLLSGSGSGTVTSSPTGIACGATCSHSFLTGSVLTLTATPAAGSTFAGWSGACAGSGQCQVTLSGDTTATAVFNSSAGPPGEDRKPPIEPPGPKPKPPPKQRLHCKKGFKVAKAHGKQRCVRIKKHRPPHKR